MIKYVLPAAVAALALGMSAGANAQMTQPKQPMMPESGMTNANATIIGQPQPALNDQGYGMSDSSTDAAPGYAAPMPGQYAPATGQYAPAMSPRTTWIPGHYNWDPNTSNYVWTGGQYLEAPTTTAQWTPGHWAQTPTSWIWIQGGWH